MRRGDRSLKKSAQKFSKEKVSVKATYFGELGITLGGAQVVNVPGRAGFVFARLNGNTSELIQALNTTVPSAYGLNVQIQRDGQNYKIIGRDVQVYSNQGTQIPGGTSPLPLHGAQHSFAPELGMGADVTWVFSRQFMPLLVYPSGSSNLLTLSPAFYEWEGSWRYAQATGAINLSSYVPTVTGTARMALVYINPATNGIEVLGGPPFSNSITSPSSLAGLIPDVDRNNSIPLAAIKLTTGTNAINWTQIYDLRDFYTVSKHWAGMGFQNGGVPLGTGTSLNFGTNLSATLLNGVVTVNATAGGGGGGIGFVAQSDGLFLVTGTTLNFVGPNVSVSASGTVARVFVTGTFITDVYSTIQKLPRGTMLNGKIEPTVSSGRLTLAVKTLDGSDPSPSNQVYVRIGDSPRSISTGTFCTLPTGTSYMNLGSAELATKETDLFAYLVWDSNSSVVAISASRYPAGNLVSDFSSTITDEKHLFNHANFTGTDEVEIIGRFATTLTATPFVWSVPTYTARNLIQRPIYETRWLDWTADFPTSTAMTVTGEVVALASYKIDMNELRYQVRVSAFTIGGTPNAIIINTLPFSALNDLQLAGAMLWVDAGGGGFGGCRVNNASPYHLYWIKDGLAAWTAGAGTALNSAGFYEI